MMYRHTTHLHGDYLDGYLTPEKKAAVEKHVAECIGCRQDLEQLKNLVVSAGQSAVPDPGDQYFDSMTEAVMARTAGLSIETASSAVQDFRGRGRQTLLTLIKLVAAVTLLFTAFYISDFNQQKHESRWAEHIRKRNLANSNGELQDQVGPSSGINMFPGLPSPADPENTTDTATNVDK